MKISLLTIWHIQNYGAEMQAYATCKVLRNLGCDVELIDYRIDEVVSCNILKSAVRNFINSLTPNNFYFQRFWKRYMPMVKRYRNIGELRRNPPQADLYLVGSDQVWNPDITGVSAPAFFLDFGSEKQRRASYASSFGFAQWGQPSNITYSANKALHRFERLSCREITGVNILKETFNLEGVRVLDPTLLLDDYSIVIGAPEEKNIITYYPLSPNAEIEGLCNKLSRELGRPVVNVNKKKVLRNFVICRTPIEKWLEGIASASLVVTSSFHGLTMSILHKRQFVLIMTDKLILERSSRVVDLLKELNLVERFFTSVEEAYNSRVWETPIDYVAVNKRLCELREESMSYLKSLII